MGRNRQIDQRIRCPALDDRHILKTIFRPVFRKKSQGIFFALDRPDFAVRTGEGSLNTHRTGAGAHIP